MELTKEELREAILHSTFLALNHAEKNDIFFKKGLLEQIQVQIRRAEMKTHRNPLLHKGMNYFSQNDEDGIFLEILRRCEIKCGNFIEFGVGDGLENNTIILLMHGWKGHWFGGEDLAFQWEQKNSNLYYEKLWIHAENSVSLIDRACEKLCTSHFDVFSIDLDGIDIYIVDAIMKKGYRPKIIVCEYNAKFPPPVEFMVEYSQGFQWDLTDYSGSSIQSYANMMYKYGYFLVDCNISGINAFFVESSYIEKFKDIPKHIDDLYTPPNDGILYTLNHKPSPRTILSFIVNKQA